MSDFPLDEDLNSPPISPSPSDGVQLDVQMLSTSSGLSPEEMTPTQLNFTWASGDIPVLLYDEAYVDVDRAAKEFSMSDLTIASAVNVGMEDRNRHSSSMSVACWSDVNDASHRVSRLSWTSRHDSGLLGLQSFDSSNTISSVGTFGPGRKNHRNSNEQSTPDSFPVSITSLDYSTSASFGAQQQEADDCVFNSGTMKSGSSIPKNLAGIFASPSVLADLKRASTAEKLSYNISETSGTRKERRESDARDSITEVDISSVTVQLEQSGLESPTTPRKPIPKTISWISSRDWDCQQYKKYVAQADLSFSPQSPTRVLRPSPNCANEDEDTNSTPSPRLRRRSPIRSKVLENRDFNVIVETSRASRFAREIHEHYADKSIPREAHRTTPPQNQVHQVEHRWLKDITVQFLIDQEGFRAAHPSFKFSGISRLRYPHNPKSSTTTMAQFRPITRQAFHFHYAPFESPPILRRVTVNFDETHDYLTKQALLTLKSNGVYVLHGQEVSNAPQEAAEPFKLYWQFEYMIDDRRVEGSGRIMEGEKNFIPLTFSSSPALLLPAQGKRNSIMHVFKKGLAIKLVSEKLQPPGMSPAPSKPAANEPQHPTLGDATHIAHFFTSKAQAWNIHKRGQSHGVQNTSPPKAPWHKTQLRNMEATTETVLAQHRRASSEVENQRPSSKIHSARHPENRNAVSVMIPASRHIIPPQKLAELLDKGSPPSNFGPIAPARHSSNFAPLTPRPRNTSHNRGLSHFRTP